MLQFAFEPVKQDIANPTTRLRFVEVVRALNRLGVSADLLHDGARSEVLVWGRRNWDLDVDRLRQQHHRVVLDFTDNLLAYPHLTCNARRRFDVLMWRLRDRARIQRFIASFDAMVVGSRWLAERVREAFAGPVYVIEDGQPTITLTRRPEPRFDAVWIGMNNNIEYLFEVFGDDRQFADIDLKVITARYKSRTYRGTRSNAVLTTQLPFSAHFVEWQLGRYLKDLAECRVGLAPLPPNEVTCAKTGNKLVLYAALGIPFLCSDIPAYRNFVTRHGLGRICRSRDDWLSGLQELRADEGLRARVARRGPEVVARHYGMDVIARKYLRLYANVTGARHEDWQCKR